MNHTLIAGPGQRLCQCARSCGSKPTLVAQSTWYTHLLSSGRQQANAINMVAATSPELNKLVWGAVPSKAGDNSAHSTRRLVKRRREYAALDESEAEEQESGIREVRGNSYLFM